MFVHPYHQHINGSFIHVINTSTVPSSTPSTHQRSVHPHPSTHQHCQHFNASFIYTINTSTVRTISIPIPSTLTMYLSWSFYTLYLVARQVGVTLGDSGLCCCVPCLSSAVVSLCLLILHKRSRPHSVSDYNNSLWSQRVSVYKNWFCRMLLHTCVAECVWNGGYMPLGGALS